MRLLNKLKAKLLLKLMSELCVKSGGCRMCPARLGENRRMVYQCAHGYVYEQAEKCWGDSDVVDVIEKEEVGEVEE